MVVAVFSSFVWERPLGPSLFLRRTLTLHHKAALHPLLGQPLGHVHWFYNTMLKNAVRIILNYYCTVRLFVKKCKCTKKYLFMVVFQASWILVIIQSDDKNTTFSKWVQDCRAPLSVGWKWLLSNNMNVLGERSRSTINTVIFEINWLVKSLHPEDQFGGIHGPNELLCSPRPSPVTFLLITRPLPPAPATEEGAKGNYDPTGATSEEQELSSG